MRTVDAEAAPKASEELCEEKYERRLDSPEDEDATQDWRSWRADEFRRHRRIDRLGTAGAAALGALLLYAAWHGLNGR